MEKLKKIWKNRNKIFRGVWNTWFSSYYIKEIATRRLELCKSNVCGLYDPKGVHEICVKKGSGCCTGCGCNGEYKVADLKSFCFLKEIGETPLWDVEMSYKEYINYKKLK